MVHGDDFTFTGDDASLRWVEELMSKWYEVKVRARLGPGEKDDKEATLLGRIVRWEGWGISWRGEPEVQRVSVGGFGLEGRLEELDVAKHKGRGQGRRLAT